MSWQSRESAKDFGYKSKNNDKFRSYVMGYIQLTEEFQGNAGEKRIGCRFWNTDKCSIHSGGHCENCEVFCNMLAQLYMYENTFWTMFKTEVK